MKKTGFIGYGHMGSALLESLLLSGALDPKNIVITTRTVGKLEPLKERYPQIEIARSSREVAVKCSRIFICTSTSQVAGTIGDILGVIDETTHLITIAGGLEIKSIESVFDGKITRLLPTLICEVGEGFSFVCHNQKVDEAEKAFFMDILTRIGKVKTINEDMFDIGGILTSCAPALFASMLHHFGGAAARSGGFSYEEACELLLFTLSGTANLLIQRKETFDELVTRVATKGGSTEQGVKVLNNDLPAVMDDMIRKALMPYDVRKQQTSKQFDELKTTLNES